MSKHTARWSVEFQELGGYDCMTAAYIIKDADGGVVAELDLRHYGQDNNVSYDVAAPRALANAHLIAAAPELNDSCSYLDYAAEGTGYEGADDDEIIEIRLTAKALKDNHAAIARARGQEAKTS